MRDRRDHFQETNYAGAGRFMGVLTNALVTFPLAWGAWAARGLSRGGQDDVPLAILFAINVFGAGVFNILGYSLPRSLAVYRKVRWTAVTLNTTWQILLALAFLRDAVLSGIGEVFATGCLSVFALINLLAMYLRTPDPGET